MFTHFNNTQFRRYIVAFGSLFRNVVVTRNDAANTEVQRMVVPIEYGPKERWFTRLAQDPNITQGVRMVLPRIAYELKGINYDGGRHLETLNRLTFPSTEQRKQARLYVGVPYTLTFSLSILVKLAQDGYQIVEQILPFFTPDLTFALNVIPELGLVDQVPVTLQSVTQTDNYEGDFEHVRFIEWNLTFSMAVNFYSNRTKQSRIEEVLVDLYIAPENDLLAPPLFLEQEMGGHILAEDESGFIVDESTSNTYLTTGRVARIDTIADPLDQQPVSKDDITAETTLTEYAGDVKRNYLLEDENP